MKSNFEASLAKLLVHEGGYVNHPADPGGMTNLGVTKRVWDEFTGKTSSEAEMRLLTPSQVAPLYKARYWDACKCDELPSGVDYCVFDAAVNSGPKQSAKWLQRAVGVIDDGAIGKMTIAAVNDLTPAEVIRRFNEQRMAFLQGLKTFATFGKGWSRRVADVQVVASAMSQTTTA